MNIDRNKGYTDDEIAGFKLQQHRRIAALKRRETAPEEIPECPTGLCEWVCPNGEWIIQLCDTCQQAEQEHYDYFHSQGRLYAHN